LILSGHAHPTESLQAQQGAGLGMMRQQVAAMFARSETDELIDIKST
jgi:hypothetical protein